MLLYYIAVILSYLLYQAAVGGLFFVLAKINTNNPLISSVFLMVEPIMMLTLGIYTAKLVDTLRVKISSNFYILCSLATFLSFICLYFIQLRHAAISFILLSYGLLTIAFMIERIYRQRLARDFSKSTGINKSRVNAIANLANRGAPILSPFVLYLFPNGLDEKYLFSFIAISFLATVTFCGLSQKINILHQQNNTFVQDQMPYYQAERLGVWHIYHLFLMNLMLGGLFMVLSQSILTSTNILHFLQGPTLYFTGFWLMMLFLMISPRKNIITPYNGLCFTATLGLFLIFSSYGGIISIFALACAGLCYGLAINQLGTFIQNQLDHNRYSYYETRAQTCGRIALLMGLSITGWALHSKFSIEFLRGVMGFGVIISAGLLGFIFLKYVCMQERGILPQKI